MSMNLANLINDGKLKKSFMVATLVSTLLGTFTAAATLHDKIQDKRQQARQKQTDEGQDGQIQQLRQDVERIRDQRDQAQAKSAESDRSRSQSRSRRSRRRSPYEDDYYDDDRSDGFDRSAQRSKALIQQEFDANVQRMGQRYAQGDMIAENKLKDQIIQLQQTVIDVLQDALLSGRSLSRADIQKLIAAQDRAKDGSLDAMRDQYQRMLITEGRRKSLGYDDRAPRKQLTLPATLQQADASYSYAYDDSFPAPRRVQTVPANLGNNYSDPSELFCRYAVDLQTNSRKQIHPSFSPGGSQRCPACSDYINVTTQNVWVFETRTPLPSSQQDDRGDLVELRSYKMDARLVLKSHTADGDGGSKFACMLCWNDDRRERDAMCASVEALVRHIGRDHSREDLEGEVDIWRE